MRLTIPVLVVHDDGELCLWGEQVLRIEPAVAMRVRRALEDALPTDRNDYSNRPASGPATAHHWGRKTVVQFETRGESTVLLDAHGVKLLLAKSPQAHPNALMRCRPAAVADILVWAERVEAARPVEVLRMTSEGQIWVEGAAGGLPEGVEPGEAFRAVWEAVRREFGAVSAGPASLAAGWCRMSGLMREPMGQRSWLALEVNPGHQVAMGALTLHARPPGGSTTVPLDQRIAWLLEWAIGSAAPQWVMGLDPAALSRDEVWVEVPGAVEGGRGTVRLTREMLEQLRFPEVWKIEPCERPTADVLRRLVDEVRRAPIHPFGAESAPMLLSTGSTMSGRIADSDPRLQAHPREVPAPSGRHELAKGRRGG